MRREAVRAAPAHDLREKTLVFPRESSHNAAAGVEHASDEPALPRWGLSHLGRQTECERIPRPRKFCFTVQRHLCAGCHPLLLVTLSPRWKFPFAEDIAVAYWTLSESFG